MIHSSTYAVPMYSRDTTEETQDKMAYAVRMAWSKLGHKLTVGNYYIARITDETRTDTHNGLVVNTDYIVRVDLRERP